MKPAIALIDAGRAALNALTAAVYPPDVVDASPGRNIRGARPEHSVLVFAPDGALVSLRQDHLRPFHARLGWRAFGGRLLIEQPEGRVELTLNRAVLLAGAPRA